jgi:hypothetical protein
MIPGTGKKSGINQEKKEKIRRDLTILINGTYLLIGFCRCRHYDFGRDKKEVGGGNTRRGSSLRHTTQACRAEKARPKLPV